MASSDRGTYWIVSVPNWWAVGSVLKNQPLNPQQEEEQKRLTRRALVMKTERLCEQYELKIPKLKVGTLDSLMSLSDELGKIDTAAEALVRKIKRTYADMKGKEAQELQVEGKTPFGYVEEWQWNAAKYPILATLRDLATKIQQEIFSNDEDLKKKMAKYIEFQTSVAAIERKETGTLLVKPLGPLVDPKDIIDGEFITSLLVVVPKAKEQEFLATYELLEDEANTARKEDADRVAAQQAAHAQAHPKEPSAAPADEKHGAAAPAPAAPVDWKSVQGRLSELDGNQLKQLELQAQEEEREQERKLQERRKKREMTIKNVVPRSAKRVAQDAEYVLFRVVVFKKGADTFKNLCREKRYTVRPYDYDPAQAEADKDKRHELTQKKNQLLGTLIIWLETKYSEIFVAWLHLKAIRTYVEAVLRFGIPVNFQANLLKVRKGQHGKLRKTLNTMYSNLGSGDSSGAAADSDNAGDMTALGASAEFFPYVFFGIDLEDEQ